MPCLPPCFSQLTSLRVLADCLWLPARSLLVYSCIRQQSLHGACGSRLTAPARSRPFCRPCRASSACWRAFNWRLLSARRLLAQMSGLCEYVDVKARDHVNMKYYSHGLSPRFPGLIHFIFVDVAASEYFAPRMTPEHDAEGQQDVEVEAAAMEQLRVAVWAMVDNARCGAERGSTASCRCSL